MAEKILLDWGVMSYLSVGEGKKTILYIHGAGNRKEVWQEVMENLSGVKQIAIDLPGHGASSCKYEESIEEYALRVEEFMEHLNLSDVIVAGHSMGGAIAIKLLSISSRIKGAMLIGTGASLPVNPKLLNGLKENFLETVDYMVKWCFRKGVSIDLIKRGKELMVQAGQEVLYRDLYACSQYSGVEDLKKSKVPALVICGSSDVMTPPSFSEEVKELLERSELSIIHNAGHMVQLEEPMFVAEKIKVWLETL